MAVCKRVYRTGDRATFRTCNRKLIYFIKALEAPPSARLVGGGPA
jgi:hypothetical protein